MLGLTLPPRTTDALGEEVAAEFAQWAVETFALRDQSVSRDAYREILSRMDILEHDVSGLKTEVAEFRRETNMRLDAVNARFDAMEERFDARFDRLQSDINARFDRMQSDINARFDAVNSEMNARFDAVNARFDTMEERFDARFDAMNARIDTIHDVVRSQTRWLIATLIALGGLISVLITILEFIQ